MTARALVLAALSGVMLTGCGPGASYAPADTAKVIDSIKADEVRWNADWRSGDPAKVVSHYAPNAVFMSNGLSPVVGVEAIQAAVGKAFERPGFSLTFASEHVDVAASGDLAVSRGSYRQGAADAAGARRYESGSYVTVYKPQADGGWKAVWDINTPGAPEAAAAP